MTPAWSREIYTWLTGTPKPKIESVLERILLPLFWISLFVWAYQPANHIQIHDGIPPETVIFDIYKFNEYIWELGYTDELVDFYVNSPFTLAIFYPLAYIKDAFLAKGIFNVLSIVCFLW